ncbi:MAG: CPBP family intramembrane glutamic endopeptidase, partial [Leifsonia sp.]
RQRKATLWGLFITSFLFMSLHLPQIWDGVDGFSLATGTFVGGFVLGVFAASTGRIGPGIVVHAAANGYATYLVNFT